VEGVAAAAAVEEEAEADAEVEVAAEGGVAGPAARAVAEPPSRAGDLAVGRGPAATARRRLASQEAIGDRAVVLGHRAADRRWLSGREPVAVVAADPAERGLARRRAIGDRVVVTDPELAVDATWAGRGLRSDPMPAHARELTVDPEAAAQLLQAGPPRDPISEAGQALAVDLASADPVSVVDPVSAADPVPADLTLVARPGLAAAQVSQIGRLTDLRLAVGPESLTDPRSAAETVSPTGGADPVYLRSLQGPLVPRSGAASPIATAIVPLPLCQDWATTGWAPASSPPIPRPRIGETRSTTALEAARAGRNNYRRAMEPRCETTGNRTGNKGATIGRRIQRIGNRTANRDARTGRRTQRIGNRTANRDVRTGHRTQRIGNRTGNRDVRTGRRTQRIGKKTAVKGVRVGKRTARTSARAGKTIAMTCARVGKTIETAPATTGRTGLAIITGGIAIGTAVTRRVTGTNGILCGTTTRSRLPPA
jgi:hypothetical protein